ncbi:MAG: EAL domain-containing protein, partial [Burkholderiales bacterium]|nr:EAL domain-containing protein [Burkholderiales bacterium]
LTGDISFGLQYIEREKQLSYLAMNDMVTGLPNRALFVDRLAQQLYAARQAQAASTVILLNIDHFNQINERHGRPVGDKVLRQLAERWQGALHEPFSLARLGGDIFGVAVGNLPAGADAVTILRDRLFRPLEAPLEVDGNEIWLSVRAGVAMFPDDGDDAEALLKHAEAALKQCKKSNKRYMYYDPQLNSRIVEKLTLEAELRAALGANEFELHYQPRVDLATGKIVAAEALLRWNHPQRGQVPPAQFIPLAEDCGLIVPIGNWVIDTVCAQQGEWQRRGHTIVPTSINVSAVQLGYKPLKRKLKDALDAANVEPKYLELEITESAVMQDPELASRILQDLRALGLRLSLDDFGTGYSSLAYIKQFPFDCIKIDRTFISEITQNPDDAAITTAIIAMAHRLRRRTVAEGVETEAQLRFLERNDCDEIQGFYASRPMPAADFAELLATRPRLVSKQEAVESTLTLLLVDDESNVLSALKRTLRNDRYKVLTASGGQEALEVLALNPVQVIMSDQRMPGMSGTEFLSVARQLYPGTVRMVLSGYADLQTITESINSGEIYKFLTKPWDDAQLRDVIDEAFQRYGATLDADTAPR